MPYITKEERTKYDIDLIDIIDRLAFKHTYVSAGDLTYILYSIIDAYLTGVSRSISGGVHYADFATVLAALESTKLELYRRQIGPYEDRKIAENGDVYTA